jgi:3-oxoacyl-[acyl-carrier-protein] synthase II
MKCIDRIVVTGIGLVSSIGYSVDKVWRNLLTGKERFIEKEIHQNSEPKKVQVAHISDFEPEMHFKRKIVKPLDQATRFCIASVLKALENSSLEITESVSKKTGIISGSMYHGLGSIFKFKKGCFEDGKEWIRPMHFPGIVFNSLPGQAAIECKIKGPNSTVNFGAASGLFSVLKGMEYLKAGRADCVIAGGTEMLHDFLLFKYAGLNKIATNCGTVHAKPFDKERNGFLLGEGSCFFMLEKEKNARKRNANIYGEIENYHTCYRPDLNDDDTIDQIADCIAKASSHTGYTNVDALICDGSGDPKLDALEARALERLYKKSSPWISSVKANIGHTLGASGAFNLFTGLMAMVDDRLPPINNLKNEAFNLNFAKKPIEAPMNRLIVNSIDFRHNCASVCIKKYIPE